MERLLSMLSIQAFGVEKPAFLIYLANLFDCRLLHSALTIAPQKL